MAKDTVSQIHLKRRIGSSRFLQRPQKRSRGNQLIHMR